MTNRWLILGVLTFARTVMGFQFQSVVAIGPPLRASFDLDFAALGTLIGLYLLPGTATALPSGVLAQRFGDKLGAVAGLAAMTAGGILMALSDHSALLTFGRLLSGCGAVLLNVLITKMVTDWFQARQIATALGILIVSWPLGIALALIVLPPLAAASSWRVALLSVAALAGLALLFVGLLYRSSPSVQNVVPRLRIDLKRHEIALVIFSGMVWTFYNVSMILVLAFGPAWLSAQGQNPQSASAMVSVVSWVIIPTVPLGAWLAERLNRPIGTMTICFVALVLAIWLLPMVGVSLKLLTIIGVIFGLPGGLIMALPGQAAAPERRAVAMGIYFTCYYLGMGIVPGLAGFARDASGSAAAPLYLAGTMMIFATVALFMFRLVKVRTAPT